MAASEEQKNTKKTQRHTHKKNIALSLIFQPNERLLVLEIDMNRKQKFIAMVAIYDMFCTVMLD